MGQWKTIHISEGTEEIYRRRGEIRARGISSMLEAYMMVKAVDPNLLETTKLVRRQLREHRQERELKKYCERLQGLLKNYNFK